MKREDRKS